MSRYRIRLVIILATFSLVGITLTQMFWVRKAFDLREKQFNNSMNIALKGVADEINRCNNLPPSVQNPVEQLSTNYYTVRVNNFIDPYQLEEFLKNEFKNREIAKDFEYGIYDCSNEKMVYGDYVNLESKNPNQKQATRFPKLDNDSYYFGVYFPTKDTGLLAQMGIWTFSSLVMLIVIVFFAYTLFVILKQRRLSVIQKEFVNNMTHEFKTPISTIAISAEVLKNPSIIEDPERLQNYASIIREESVRLKNQVERVLQMATVDKEKVNLKIEKVNLHDIISQTIQSLKLSVENSAGNISCDLQARHTCIEADKLHVTNILYNLLDNALKYCKVVPKIKIVTEDITRGIIIKIVDNGIGISMENQKNIFKRFFRVSTGNIHDVKGFGLGLNYVREIVMAHKGEINVYSSIGQGSTFSIFLPHENHTKKR
ncbi:HAMP domain-containing sensor histidine kinase [Fulvivirgaceae bacterium BMA12]|uniref:histidine kinase n=1 Tax=Agaribacillus aureus TaxID=3051825 RepID=A0ABT8L6E7_9BACT|nr:HAMP domain-containing sensor histidine kinase [Fulvivirgaceae bacterium BMA12]